MSSMFHHSTSDAMHSVDFIWHEDTMQSGQWADYSVLLTLYEAYRQPYMTQETALHLSGEVLCFYVRGAVWVLICCPAQAA